MFVFLLFRAMWRMWITCAFGTWCHSTFSWRINIGQQRCLLLESVRRVELALIANPTISLAGAGGVPANGHSWNRSAFYRVLLGFSLGFHRSADRCRPVAGLVEKKKTLDCFFYKLALIAFPFTDRVSNLHRVALGCSFFYKFFFHLAIVLLLGSSVLFSLDITDDKSFRRATYQLCRDFSTR